MSRSTRRRGRTVCVCRWVLGLVLLGCSPTTDGTDAGGLPPAPDFTLPDLDGQPVRLSDFRGKTVLIDFWATWCAPCEAQVPLLNEFWRTQREGDEVVLLGVAVDAEGAEVVRPWVEDKGVEYTILIGDEVVARSFGTLGFPTLAVVTPAGRVDSLHVGLIELDELAEILALVGTHRST